MAGKETKHPHRGFDNIWYVFQGSASTGHTTGPGGSMERARLSEGRSSAQDGARRVARRGHGSRRGRRGPGDTEFRSVLFWVNLARKDKEVEPSAQCCIGTDSGAPGGRRHRASTDRGRIAYRVRNAGPILDVALPRGGAFVYPVPSDFNGFIYMLEGDARLGANRLRARRAQIALLGSGDTLVVADASSGTRFLLMAGKPYGETPIFNGPYVD